jgi:hypothetical protein
MLWFLTHRLDLGMILLFGDEESDMRISCGDVMGSRWGDVGAGVQAVILACTIPDPESEAMALAKLAAGEVSKRRVHHWASVDREWSPVDISDLVDGREELLPT